MVGFKAPVWLSVVGVGGSRVFGVEAWVWCSGFCACGLEFAVLGRPLGYSIFSLVALIRDPIY